MLCLFICMLMEKVHSHKRFTDCTQNPNETGYQQKEASSYLIEKARKKSTKTNYTNKESESQ